MGLPSPELPDGAPDLCPWGPALWESGTLAVLLSPEAKAGEEKASPRAGSPPLPLHSRALRPPEGPVALQVSTPGDSVEPPGEAGRRGDQRPRGWSVRGGADQGCSPGLSGSFLWPCPGHLWPRGSPADLKKEFSDDRPGPAWLSSLWAPAPEPGARALPSTFRHQRRVAFRPLGTGQAACRGQSQAGTKPTQADRGGRRWGQLRGPGPAQEPITGPWWGDRGAAEGGVGGRRPESGPVGGGRGQRGSPRTWGPPLRTGSWEAARGPLGCARPGAPGWGRGPAAEPDAGGAEPHSAAPGAEPRAAKSQSRHRK